MIGFVAPGIAKWAVGEILDKEQLIASIKFLEQNEAQGKVFNRFGDFSKCKLIDLTPEDFDECVRMRQKFVTSHPIKNAIFGNDPFILRSLELLGMLAAGPNIEIDIFYSINKAAKWLDTSVETLQKNPV